MSIKLRGKRTIKLWIQGSEKNAFVENGRVCYKSAGRSVDIENKAAEDGLTSCLSWWREDKSVYITYNPDMYNAPVKLGRIEDKVKIYAVFAFYGDLVEESFVDINSSTGIVKTLPKTYADLADEGIRRVWRDNIFYADENNNFGDYEKINVSFNFRKVACGSHIPHFKIYIKDVGQPICWYNVLWSAGKKSLNPANDVVLCAKFKSIKKRIPINVWADAFRYQAAHEFGHVLGLGDAYHGVTQVGAPDNPKALAEVPADEIMRSGWHSAEVYANTMEMILEAFKTGSLQKYDPRNHSKVIRTY